LMWLGGSQLPCRLWHDWCLVAHSSGCRLCVACVLLPPPLPPSWPSLMCLWRHLPAGAALQHQWVQQAEEHQSHPQQAGCGPCCTLPHRPPGACCLGAQALATAPHDACSWGLCTCSAAATCAAHRHHPPVSVPAGCPACLPAWVSWWGCRSCTWCRTPCRCGCLRSQELHPVQVPMQGCVPARQGGTALAQGGPITASCHLPEPRSQRCMLPPPPRCAPCSCLPWS
jgi:hypothetical protein